MITKSLSRAPPPPRIATSHVMWGVGEAGAKIVQQHSVLGSNTLTGWGWGEDLPPPHTQRLIFLIANSRGVKLNSI